jgi:hypothetical protein
MTTEEERKQLEAAALRARIPVSSWVRMVALRVAEEKRDIT